MASTSFKIDLHGTGSAIKPAERAILVLQADSQLHNSAAEATMALTSTASTIRNMILPYCPVDEATGRVLTTAPISHYSMSTMDTSAHAQKPATNSDGRSSQQPTVYLYSARVKLDIKFRDFKLLNKLATELSRMDRVKISKIDWKLTDTTMDAIKSVARKEAARDAISRATDYAEVFSGHAGASGSRAVVPVNMNENQYYTQSTRPQLHVGKSLRASGRRIEKQELAFSTATGTDDEDTAALAFEPEDVRLEVSLQATFNIAL